ncbi:DNA mismatch repair protein MSH3 isoform X3 [Primulina huaijiensis]|uniref:DNA mismatch repair protein MSH3 isoform X3 n=1 Tax=Primulina huaijiensis TaxID=1492673 RepID=UPI003CC74276
MIGAEAQRNAIFRVQNRRFAAAAAAVMGKQKQQVISRFFAPKPKSYTATSSSAASPPPKITASVSFSPAKRLRTAQLTPSHSKIPKLTHPKPDEGRPFLPLPDPTLHQKFLRKLLEPSGDHLEPSRANNAQSSKLNYTPLETQVVELKRRYPDVLLMIEVGYKYRFFGEDAESAARVLGIYAHMDHNFLTASVPTFRLNFHLRRLVSAGYKVGVVKQTETASIKAHGLNSSGPFCRGLSSLYTKATIEAAEDMGGAGEGCGPCASYLLCVVEKEVGNVGGGVDLRIGAVGVEISTGDVVYGEFDDNFMRDGLEAMVLNLSPAELLLGMPLSKQTEKLLLAFAGPASNVRVDRVSNNYLHEGGALAEVMSLHEDFIENILLSNFQESIVEAEPQGNSAFAIEGIMAMPDLAVQALALTIQHLKQFGLERILCLQDSFRPFSCSREIILSANALQQLEVLKNNSDGSECGSLLQCMNHTLTMFGSRLFRHWVTHPLCHRNMIYARLDAVSEILESMGIMDFNSEYSGTAMLKLELHHIISSALIGLGRSPDIQRGITRIFHRTATPSEFITVIQAIVAAGKLLLQLHVEEEDEIKNVEVRTVKSVLLRKLISTASSSSVIRTAEKLLSTLNKEATDQRDLHNLFIITDGKFPEVSAATTNIQLANEKLDELKHQYRKQLRMSNLEFSSVSGITHLIENYVRPIFVDDDEPVQMQISSGRHPVMENMLQDYFVPNDTNLHADGQYCQIVTGPNMGGKSCYIRQVALIALMAQVGSFVPASSAKLHVLDGIYTRMGASDSLQLGKSTFLEELSEASHILRHCTSRSLVIIDELGRGTSTHDGVSIAYATLRHLLEHKRCMLLFVTHYPKIIDIRKEFPGSVGAYYVSYLTPMKESDLDANLDHVVDDANHDDVTYLYKLVPGVSERSFGFKVAQLAQLPSSCIRRATFMAARLKQEICRRENNKLLTSCSRTLLPSDKMECTGDDLPTTKIMNLLEIENACRDMLFKLRITLFKEEDTATKFGLLKHAQGLAKDLMSVLCHVNECEEK